MTPTAIVPPEGIKKILVCQLRQIGDVLLTTPSVRLLAERFPGAEIHVFTEKKCASMLENHPCISKVWALDKKAFRHFGDELAFYWRVARQGFDIVADFQQLPRCRWVVAFSRAKIRLSHTPPWYNRWLYTHCVEPEGGYAAMTKASVLAPLGVSWKDNRPELFLRPEEVEWAEGFLREMGVTPEELLVTVDPTHRRVTRCWPVEYFAGTLASAAKAEPRLKFLVLFGPGEEEIARRVQELSGLGHRCLKSPRMLTLRETAACIGGAAMHFGTCSAPQHMAVAVGTPTLVVKGATGAAWTHPSPEHRDIALDLDCRPCNSNECSHIRCLRELTPEMVVPAFFEHLGRAGC